MAGGKRPSGTPPDGTPETQGTGPEPAPERPAGSRRAKRAAPTIDLQATEIPAASTADAAASPSRESSSPADREAAADTGPSRASSRRFSDASPPPKFPMPDGISAGTLAAGLAGGLLVSIVLFVLWLTGMVPIRYAGTTAMRARVSVLEMQMHELANNRSSAQSGKAAEELAQRVGKLEQAQPTASADPKLIERLDAAENAMKALGVALAALNGRVENNATRLESAEKSADGARSNATPDAALANRLEALEKATSAAETKLAKASADDRAARLAVAATALRDAVNAGEPFANELAAVKALGADRNELAPLEALAEKGVPAEAVLVHELTAVLPAVLKAAGVDNAPQSGGFLERLQANAGKLVRVRPAGDTAGGEPGSAAARLERRVAQADIAGALAELKAMPANARQPAESWIGRAESRRSAIEASRKLAAATFRALQGQ